MRRTLLALLALIALSPLPSGAANVTVRAGDTLSDIAARYGVSVGSLMRVNGLRDSNHVEAGQTLRLPSGAAAGVTAGKGRHTVRSGDTLGAIALQYRVSERQLMALNGLASADHVEQGQTLKLPSNAVLPKPKTAAKPKLKPVPVKANPNATSHTVARGQTLTQIAKAYEIPVASLVSVNSIADPNQVTVGTKLMLRASETQPHTAAVPETKAQPRPQPQPTAKAKPVITAKANTTKTEPAIQPNKAEWKTYGPLQVDWGNWQLMGGSEVAPTLNSDGQSLYVAVNCSAGKINVTGANGSWKTWIAPQSAFERDLLKDRCKSSKG
ncbi:LysM domain-containing protein [Synechococcus sp. MEDNS5]|uniref:LysM peptidoglycan-binding domain-containing protein n=1 Tax=Synechococcus sp. MEDNS5 TaxID=1442554 RepID=UPI0016468024|nr:LysM peptidoglycan-binding domain-containing protein [Synechococcus sp. MEDNS5]QNJ05309.1 LysM domain-containing protein [Synechococcus sp. MEDNS5]